MKVAVLALCLLGAGVVASGCSLIVDDAIEDRDGGTGVVDCTGMPDGTGCGGGRICDQGECRISECGDGVVDPALGEACDDDNDVPGDGCEGDCTFSCSEASDCDDSLPCNGVETCTAEHVCEAGEPLVEGEACTQSSGDEGVCRGNDCVPAGCGNNVLDDGESCDDGNTIDGDGCDADCTYSCETDEDCDDASVCTGTESCDIASHVCVPGTLLECDDSNACTSNDCDDEMGCVYPLIDVDGDGHASIDLGACGTDCNDMRADVNPDAVELCGDALDSDCDGEPNPTSTPFWYLDCDDDGYASLAAVSQQSCAEPAPSPCGGGWTTRVPVSGDRTTYDCNDGNAAVRPSQSGYFSVAIPGASSSVDYDYNCDVVETRRWTAVSLTSASSCTGSVLSCRGTDGWVGATAPSCGVSASFSECGWNRVTDSCTRALVSRKQECR